MKCPRTIPFLHPGLALGAKRHDGFSEAWNWLIHSFWHMNLGDGLKWKDKWQGYPEIHLAIEGGEGIKVKPKDGKIYISLDNGEEDGEDPYSTGGGGGSVPGDDGYSKHYGIGEGNAYGGHADGETTGGGGSVSDSGGSASSSGGEDSCNEFSENPMNTFGDPGMENEGDSCAVVNGW